MGLSFSVNKKILRLAVPNILSNLTVPLLSSVDTAIMGHLPDPSYIGAIAIGSMIFNFLYWGVGFLRMGTTGLTAQAYGQKSNSEIIMTFSRALIVALGIAIIFLITKDLIDYISFNLINGSEEVENYARIYFQIRIFAAPATLSLYALHGWFLGMQNSRFPLYLSVLVNVLNIILNFIFVYRFNLTVDGIAWATVISQYTGLFFGLFLMRKYYSGVFRYFDKQKILELEKIKKFFNVNFDLFIRTLFLIFVFSFFTAKSAEFGDTILSANSILLQLWLILSYGVDGFAFAAESLVGKYLGGNNKRLLMKTVKYVFGWGLGQGIALSIIFLFWIREVITLYTNQQEVIETAMVFAGWTIIAPLINAACFIWDGIYIGATAAKPMRNSMIFSVIFVFLPLFYLLLPLWGNHALWLAMISFMLARGVTLTLSAKRYIFNTSVS